MKPEGSVTLSRWMVTPFLVIDGGTGYHGAFRLHVLLLLFHGGGLSLVAAQNGTAKTESGGGSNAPTDQNDSNFDPTMAILMIVLISVFFFLGFFSVYIRQCLERAINGGGGDNNGGGQRVDPGSWLTLRPAGARGLDASVIETFPTFLYSTVKTLRIGGNKQALECPVCLNEFEDHETLRLIPKCCHVFHPGCIDAWLRSHATCPLCRANLIPRPGETISLPVIPDPIPDPARETGRRSPSAMPPDHRIRRGTLDSPDERLVNSMAWSNQSMPRRSMSTGWRLAGLFSRSNSPSGSPVVGNFERFTLRLPGEVHDQLVNCTSSYGGKEHVALAQASSPTSGYRTERNYFYYERFDQDGRLDRRPFSITPPRWSGSLRSPDAVRYGGGGGSDQVSTGAPKGLLQAIRSPWDLSFIGKNNVGERSSDHLRSGYASHV